MLRTRARTSRGATSPTEVAPMQGNAYRFILLIIVSLVFLPNADRLQIRSIQCIAVTPNDFGLGFFFGSSVLGCARNDLCTVRKHLAISIARLASASVSSAVGSV